jgi:periplasmic divalent cation tolerance protein
MLIVFTTLPNADEAETLARRLVEEKLAGCVQVVPQITSFYQWENEIQKDEEYLLLIKTLPGNFDRLAEFIKSNHSYSVPEIVAVEALKVSVDYLKWLNEVIAK